MSLWVGTHSTFHSVFYSHRSDTFGPRGGGAENKRGRKNTGTRPVYGGFSSCGHYRQLHPNHGEDLRHWPCNRDWAENRKAAGRRPQER